ncbi:MAG: SxtJ family membrane protein [Bdellovibrionota bacterium]
MARGRGLARQLRTGLEDSKTMISEETPVHYLDEFWFRKPIRRHVAEFAIVFALISAVIGGVIVYKHGIVSRSLYWFAAAFILLVLGYRLPQVLHPFWKGWMKLANILNKLVTGLILSIMWMIVLVPIAFILKLIGKKVMDLSYDPQAKSYWEDREVKLHDFTLIERQF